MKTLLLILSLALVGCGKNNIDPQIQPYVDSFVQAGNLVITTPMTIKFDNLVGQAEDGLCTVNTFGAFTITVDQAAWNNNDETNRQLVVWHELGHCVLGRAHNISGGPNNPVSIMYPTAEAAHAGFTANPQPFIQELFNP